jgi:hypothetical protein
LVVLAQQQQQSTTLHQWQSVSPQIARQLCEHSRSRSWLTSLSLESPWL